MLRSRIAFVGKASPIVARTRAYYLFILGRMAGDIEENPGFALNGTGGVGRQLPSSGRMNT
jgi:hypothetical protein